METMWRAAQGEGAGGRGAAVAAVLGVVVLLLMTWRRRRRTVTGLPPGPFPWPVLGNLAQLAGGLPHRRLAELGQRFGPVCYLKLGRRHAVVVSTAAMAREFLQSHDRVFASRPPIESSNRVGYGQHRSLAVGEYGPTWRHLRRISTLQLFTAARVASFQAVRMREVQLLVRDLGAEGAGGVAVDLTARVGSLVESIMCRLLVSRRLRDVASASASASSLQEAVHRSVELAQVPVVGDFVPSLGFLDRKLKRSMGELHLHFDVLFEELIQEREQGTFSRSGPEDFLDVLMSPESALDRDCIKTLLLEILSAGIDTTAVTLDWAMAEILSNPHTLEKLQQELDNIVGRERMVEELDLPNLPYLMATIKETLRLHTPLPLLIPHMSTQPSKVAGFSLPHGTILFVNVWAIGRDPTTWTEPLKFMPERFLHKQLEESPIDVRGQHFELLPFGSGRRSCPGMALALPTLELALSNIIHCFHWSLPLGSSFVDLSEKFGIVVSRALPLLAIPTLRLDPIALSTL